MEVPSELIQNITTDTNCYLNDLHERNLRWNELEGHVQTSRIAEFIGAKIVSQRHMQSALRLMYDMLDSPQIP